MKNFKKFVKSYSNIIIRCSFALFFILAFGFGIVKPMVDESYYKLATQASAAKKKLPIYCVDTPEKKVAISFDAAWGTGRLMEIPEMAEIYQKL